MTMYSLTDLVESGGFDSLHDLFPTLAPFLGQCFTIGLGLHIPCYFIFLFERVLFGGMYVSHSDIHSCYT